jgi:deoxyribonuclease V
VMRGGARRPLFVTAAGMNVDTAAAHILNMHGAHRIPSILKRVDRLCRNSSIITD